MTPITILDVGVAYQRSSAAQDMRELAAKAVEDLEKIHHLVSADPPVAEALAHWRKQERTWAVIYAYLDGVYDAACESYIAAHGKLPDAEDTPCFHTPWEVMPEATRSELDL